MRPVKPRSINIFNSLHIEAAPTGRTHCRACSKRISEGEARISYFSSYENKSFFHPYCYRPIYTVRIDLARDECIITGGEIQAEAKEWIADWNKQFDFNPAVLQQYATKRVKTKTPANRRVLLESFKYLDLKDTASTVTGICRSWYHVSWEDELWQELTPAQFPHISTQSSSRKKFLETWLCSCAHCNEQLTNSERHMVCPLTNRPKCDACYTNEKNRPLSIKWVNYKYCITPHLIKQLSIPVFEYDDSECIYLYQAIPKIVKLRKALLDEILRRENEEFDALFTKEWIDILRTVDEKDLETDYGLRKKWNFQPLNSKQVDLFEFLMCGKGMKSFDKVISIRIIKIGRNIAC